MRAKRQTRRQDRENTETAQWEEEDSGDKGRNQVWGEKK